jgi:hypothetical protein
MRGIQDAEPYIAVFCAIEFAAVLPRDPILSSVGASANMLMPQATRLRLARALAMLRNKHVEMPGRKHNILPA